MDPKTDKILPIEGMDARRQQICIDATGLLAWRGALAGIQRIEDFMVRAALADPDPDIEVVTLDPSSRRFRPLENFEMEQLGIHEIAPFRQRPGRKRLAALRQAFEAVRRYPKAKREADRQLASLVTNGRTGLACTILRLFLRAYRLWRRAGLTAGLFHPGREHTGERAASSTVLISNHVMVGETMAELSRQTWYIVFLCHDMIPTMRPDLVGKGKMQSAFGPNLEALVRSGAAAFCTSEAAAQMLGDHMRAAGIHLPPVHRFPMPSLLHEKASRLGTTSRLDAGEPFVLYCSTIEIRKNHIMLARIWQQAIDESVRLPRLVCVGRWGWMVEELSAYLDAHPRLKDQIVFTGPVSDEELIGYYRSASFGVFPSHIEGWGYAASECLDFGIPVIVSTTPSLIEATGGLMPAIDSNDQAGWYAAIRKMAEDHAWRSSLLERIEKQHRPTPTAASWAAIKAGLKESAYRQSEGVARYWGL
ncbi:glycosyltransferase [Mesorhizobium sp. B1-1-8]|uniref:glycosyltransferase n=1 Tax=Mesorhizobium sp. B1-1-8 TaxID=2589976 RepID=UPI00112903F7|nr:glycosyltransferase [Mesorhizobium sp. B1-1-8]UCI08267.1 glycosyltransferase [Mesorhizobium sp. B1-1-8]